MWFKGFNKSFKISPTKNRNGALVTKTQGLYSPSRMTLYHKIPGRFETEKLWIKILRSRPWPYLKLLDLNLYCIEQLCIKFTNPTGIICRGVSGFATGYPCAILVLWSNLFTPICLFTSWEAIQNELVCKFGMAENSFLFIYKYIYIIYIIDSYSN